MKVQIQIVKTCKFCQNSISLKEKVCPICMQHLKKKKKVKAVKA